MLCNLQFSQNITNTLGTSGVFKIKDASTEYLSLNQSNGQLSISRTILLLNTISSTTGVVYKGTDRFLHDYQGTGTDGFNTFLGQKSGNFTLGGSVFYEASNNTGVGYRSLSSLTSGFGNSGLGYNALLFNTTGYYNSAFGYSALERNTTGTYNSAYGYHAMILNTTGSENTSVGSSSMLRNNNGTQNTAVGYNALYNNVSGWNNTAVGHHSLLNNTGNYNTALGHNSGSTITTGANLTCIGIDANPTTPTATDQITLGNQFVSSLRCNVQTITSLSDARDKKNITELSLGLDFITKLHPRQFNWDKREWYDDNVSDGSKMKDAPTAGFIAQELDSAQTTSGAEWLNLVLKDNPEKWEATYGNLLPVMVKAIQELKAENDELKKEINTLKTVNEKVTKLEEIVNALSSVRNTTLTENK